MPAERSLLSTRGNNLTDVALDCGFADQSHFARVFSALVDLTPTQWRARSRRAALARPPSI
jgi:AraC family transcriptional regulator